MFPFDVDEERFFRARAKAEERERGGIGTLSEKILHATLKNYFTFSGALQEQPVGRFVADIVEENRIIEIQTCGFVHLKRKIPEFLSLGYRVTVVCPLMRTKRLYWIDPETGERSGGRKSPKRGQPSDLLPELFYISEYIDHENFDILLFLYDGEEYRLKNGWGKDGKRGSHRVEYLPTAVVDTLYIGSSYDYGLLLPYQCPEIFSAKEFSALSGFGGIKAWAALKVLTEKGIVEKEKKGKQYKYSVKRKEFCLK